MTKIYAESLLKMLAITPGRFVIGEYFPAVDVGTFEGEVATSQAEWRTVWPRNTLYTFASSPENLYVSSSSTLDIGRIIQVVGLDSQFNRVVGWGITNGQNQAIITTLPGAGTPVVFFRLNSYIDYTPSMTKGNVANGDIYIARSTTPVGGVPPVADTRGMMVQGKSHSTAMVTTAPAGYALVMKWISFSQSGDKQIILRIRSDYAFFENGTMMWIPTNVVDFASVVPGSTQFLSEPAFFIAPQRLDISLEAIGTSPVSGTLTVKASATLIDYRIIKDFRLGGLSPPGEPSLFQ